MAKQPTGYPWGYFYSNGKEVSFHSDLTLKLDGEEIPRRVIIVQLNTSKQAESLAAKFNELINAVSKAHDAAETANQEAAQAKFVTDIVLHNAKKKRTPRKGSKPPSIESSSKSGQKLEESLTQYRREGKNWR